MLLTFALPSLPGLRMMFKKQDYYFICILLFKKCESIIECIVFHVLLAFEFYK